MRVLAIDQGTSSTRALILDAGGVGDGDGQARIIHSVAHEQFYPRPGWVEHDPLELLNNIKSCLAAAAGQIDAIGLANQGESCLAWDARSGAPVSPVIVWQDRRTQAVVDDLKARGLETVVRQSCLLPLDPYFSASKLGWIMANIPQARLLSARGHLRLGTTDAFFLDRLCGQFATDVTTASRTSLMNLKTLRWDPALCDIFGVPISALPQIRPSMGDFGHVELAGRRTPVRASVVDQQASLYGHGCRHPGDAKITFGTGAFALAVTPALPAATNGTFATVAWQATDAAPVFALEGGVYCAGSAINWAKSLGLFADFDQINQFTAAPAIGRNLAFVPALTGLACPHWDGSAAGMWIGMTLDTTPLDLVQAILEGIAFRTAEVLDAMATQISLGDTISIDGGLSVNPYFCQFLADVLRKEVVVPNQTEITALGVARMAAGQKDRAADPAADPTCPPRKYSPLPAQGDAKLRYKDAVSRAKRWH